MTAKDYLRQLIDIDQDIRDYQDEILRIRTGMEKMTPQLSGMPMGSPDPDKLAGHMDGLITWQRKMEQAVDDACRLKAETLDLINRMPDETLARILMKRYIYGKPFTLIAVELNYNYNWTCQMHGRALKAFERVLNADNKLMIK